MSMKEVSTVTSTADLTFVPCPQSQGCSLISAVPSLLSKCKVGVNAVHEFVTATVSGTASGAPCTCTGNITTQGSRLIVSTKYPNVEGDSKQLTPTGAGTGGTVTINSGTQKPTPNKLIVYSCMFWIPVICFSILLLSFINLYVM